jgi:hypothetical protein
MELLYKPPFQSSPELSTLSSWAAKGLTLTEEAHQVGIMVEVLPELKMDLLAAAQRIFEQQCHFPPESLSLLVEAVQTVSVAQTEAMVG